jgi:hypothetical protein
MISELARAMLRCMSQRSSRLGDTKNQNFQNQGHENCSRARSTGFQKTYALAAKSRIEDTLNAPLTNCMFSMHNLML